jgi:hypothetical protein
MTTTVIDVEYDSYVPPDDNLYTSIANRNVVRRGHPGLSGMGFTVFRKYTRVCCLGLRTLIEVLLVYAIVHFVDFLLAKYVFQVKPCIKIFGFETSPRGSGLYTRSDLGFGWRFRNSEYLVHIWSNEVCPYRLFGIILVTWLTYWWCVVYSFFSVGEEQAASVTTVEEVFVAENGATGGAGTII